MSGDSTSSSRPAVATVEADSLSRASPVITRARLCCFIEASFPRAISIVYSGWVYGVMYSSSSSYARMKRKKVNTSDKPHHSPDNPPPLRSSPPFFSFFASGPSSILGGVLRHIRSLSDISL